MRAITLFSGIGGFDVALDRAGVVVDSVCEIDKAAQSVLVRRFPEAKLFDDVKKVGVNTHAKRSIDIICGGFPCQDLSIAGKRKGLAGERSGLWFEFARVIDELEPQWVIIENVPGLLSSGKGSDFAVILQWLAERGYCVAWRVLDAQYFGVAQRRRRVFVVASFGNGRAAEILFESEGGFWNTPPSREAGKEVAYSLRANPSHSGDKGDGGINTTMIAQTLTGGGNGNRGYIDPVNTTLIPDAMTFTVRSGKEGGGKGYLGQESLAMTLGGQQQHLAFSRQRSDEYKESEIVSTISQRDYKSASDLIAWEMQHASEAYRETQGGISPTLQSRMGTGGNNVPMVGVRRLTPLECERLQGFPDGWTEGQSDSARYKQLGNAVAVPVVEWIVNRIAA